MSALTHTIEIDRPPDEVFAYASDLLHFPEWQADVLEVHFEGAGGRKVGRGSPPPAGSDPTSAR